MKKLLFCIIAMMSCKAETTLVISSVNLSPINCEQTSAASVSLFVAGGQPPYSFQIDSTAPQDSPTFDGINIPGDHVFAVTDSNGNTATTTVNVGSSVFLQVILSAAAPCSGQSNGVLSVFEEGGITPITYTLEDESGAVLDQNMTGRFENLAAAQYVVDVASSDTPTDCPSTTIRITLPSPAPLEISSIKTTPQQGSQGGTIVVEATGGVGPYLYSLDGETVQESNTFTNVAAGTYTILVQDSNNFACTTSEDTVVESGNSINSFIEEKYCSISGS